MKYKILYELDLDGIVYSVEKLVKSVNEHIDKGWEPVGGIAIYGREVFQAIIKRE